MAIIRNLTNVDIELDDLNGITIEANSDYDLNLESVNEVASSLRLKTELASGNITYLDDNSMPMSVEESVKVNTNLSSAFNDIVVKVNGNNIPNTPHKAINFIGDDIVVTDNGSGEVGITYDGSANIVGTLYPMVFMYGSRIRNRWLSYSGQSSIPSNSTNAVIPFHSNLIGMTYTNRRSSTVDIELHKALYGDGGSDSMIFKWNIEEYRTFSDSTDTNMGVFKRGDKIGMFCRTPDNKLLPDDVVVVLYFQIIQSINNTIYENYTNRF